MLKLLKTILVTGLIAWLPLGSFAQSSSTDKYTYDAIDNHIEGKVYITLMLDDNGKIIQD